MEHNLINTLVISIVTAFLCGFAAKKMKMPTIFGYLLAGILVGPYTPGFVGDIDIAQQFAEIGIILLMFGVGLHFSIDDLFKVKDIALPGAIFQIVTATIIGWLAAKLMGFSDIGGIIFGFTLSTASTIVLLRTLEQRHSVQTKSGNIAIGWLIVEDIAMVMAVVLLPVILDITQTHQDMPTHLLFSKILGVIFKISGFVALMIIVGRRLLPKIIVSIAELKSRELSSLGTLAIALGFAYLAYTVFNASFALGAFFAGMVMSESEIGRKTAEQTLPMRDAFAVLFFVSVGMLFDPMILLTHPLWVIVTLAIVVLGKSLAALCITYLLKQDREVSFTIAFSLAQIGEFSFILAGMAFNMGIMEKELYSIVLAASLLSIAINPFLFKLLDHKERKVTE